MNLGDPITKQLTSARLYVQFLGEAFYRDLGNLKDYKPDPKFDRKEHMASQQGVKNTDLSLVASITNKWVFTPDEHTPDLESLLILGTQGNDSVQAGGNTNDEPLTNNSQQGRTYFAAKQGLSAVVVKVAAAVQVLGVDYDIDLGSGAVTIRNGGGIVNGSTVTISYTAAAVTMLTFTGLTDLFKKAAFKLLEYDQFSQVPRRTSTFNGQLYITGWGDNKGDYNEPTLEVLVYGKPNIQVRKD